MTAADVLAVATYCCCPLSAGASRETSKSFDAAALPRGPLPCAPDAAPAPAASPCVEFTASGRVDSGSRKAGRVTCKATATWGTPVFGVACREHTYTCSPLQRTPSLFLINSNFSRPPRCVCNYLSKYTWQLQHHVHAVCVLVLHHLHGDHSLRNRLCCKNCCRASHLVKGICCRRQNCGSSEVLM